MIFTSVRRYAAALVGCAAVAAVPLVADAANFAGAWSVVGVMGRVSNTAPTCVFRQVGNRVAGTCKGPAGIGSAAASSAATRSSGSGTGSRPSASRSTAS